MQTRGSAHDHSIRQVRIGSDGMRIAEPATGTTGILSGTTPLPAPPGTADPPPSQSPRPDG